MTKPKTTEVFKVLRVSSPNNELVSVFVQGHLCRTYTPGEVTLPFKGTQLLAFDTLENALRFTGPSGLYRRQIWKAEATKVKPQSLTSWKITQGEPVSWQFVRAFWAHLRGKAPEDGSYKASKAYKGTVGCDTIKLLEQVQ